MFNTVAPNGLTLSKSVTDKDSRLAKIVNYIRENGPTRKKDLVFHLFDRTMGRVQYDYSRTPYRTFVSDDTGKKKVTYGWGTYVFGLAVKNGILTKNRVGRTVQWGLGPNHNKVV